MGRGMDSSVKEGQDVVLEWDVTDGALLGALIVCRSCAGSGQNRWTVEPWTSCEECSGDGVLHRPYQLPEATGPSPAAYLAPAVPMPSTLDALEAAIRLMEQRSTVLRKVLDQERARVKQEALRAEAAAFGAAAQANLLAGYAPTDGPAERAQTDREVQAKTGQDGELLIASGVGRPIGEWRGVTWPMDTERADDGGVTEWH